MVYGNMHQSNSYDYCTYVFLRLKFVVDEALKNSLPLFKKQYLKSKKGNGDIGLAAMHCSRVLSDLNQDCMLISPCDICTHKLNCIRFGISVHQMKESPMTLLPRGLFISSADLSDIKKSLHIIIWKIILPSILNPAQMINLSCFCDDIELFRIYLFIHYRTRQFSYSRRNRDSSMKIIHSNHFAFNLICSIAHVFEALYSGTQLLGQQVSDHAPAYLTFFLGIQFI